MLVVAVELLSRAAQVVQAVQVGAGMVRLEMALLVEMQRLIQAVAVAVLAQARRLVVPQGVRAALALS
jgi:hypothetical protein